MNKIILKEKLDLELSLFSGQAFRWKKKLNWYYGFIDNKFLKLRIKNNCLEYVCSDDWVAQDKVYDYFGLGIKYDEIFENFDDELFTVAYKKLQGMRVLNQDPWECLISFIISAWSNVPKISNTIHLLCQKLGHKYILDDIVGYSFPSPIQITGLTESEMKSFGLGYRGQYVLKTSKIIEENKILLSDFYNEDYFDSLKFLLTFPGVGDKVANCVLIYSLKKYNAFPVDLWVERLLVEDYGLNKKMSLINKRKWGQNYFGKYTGIIQHYLFHYKRKYNH
jgi:N-glycosylase/DNA lyase